jgi:hypothetical protein
MIKEFGFCSASGIFSIKSSIDIMKYCKENNPTQVTEKVMQNIFGSLPFNVEFEGDMQKPEIIYQALPILRFRYPPYFLMVKAITYLPI